MLSGRRRPAARPPTRSIRIISYRSSHLSSDRPSTVPTPGDLAAITRRQPSTKRRVLDQEQPLVTSSTMTPVCFMITLPIPPSINHQYATVNGRRLLSSAGRAYKAQVGQQVWIAVAQSKSRSELIERLHSGPLALSIRFFFTSTLRRDVDGGLKIAQDAVCEGLGLNDNRIVETHLFKAVDKANPRMEVTLGPAPPVSPAT